MKLDDLIERLNTEWFSKDLDPRPTMMATLRTIRDMLTAPAPQQAGELPAVGEWCDNFCLLDCEFGFRVAAELSNKPDCPVCGGKVWKLSGGIYIWRRTQAANPVEPAPAQPSEPATGEARFGSPQLTAGKRSKPCETCDGEGTVELRDEHIGSSLPEPCPDCRQPSEPAEVTTENLSKILTVAPDYTRMSWTTVGEVRHAVEADIRANIARATAEKDKKIAELRKDRDRLSAAVDQHVIARQRLTNYLEAKHPMTCDHAGGPEPAAVVVMEELKAQHTRDQERVAELEKLAEQRRDRAKAAEQERDEWERRHREQRETVVTTRDERDAARTELERVCAAIAEHGCYTALPLHEAVAMVCKESKGRGTKISAMYQQAFGLEAKLARRTALLKDVPELRHGNGWSEWFLRRDAELATDQPAAPKQAPCGTCHGMREIVRDRIGDGPEGHTEPCPDCTDQSAPSAPRGELATDQPAAPKDDAHA